MAPTLYAFSAGSLANNLSSRAENDSNFQSTPIEAVVVPVVLLVVLLLSAAIISTFSYWRRRHDRDRLLKAATPTASRKLIPEWLSNWLGSANAKPVNAPEDGRGTMNTGHSSFDNLSKPSADEHSDAIALRPISVCLPLHPLTVHDPYDRYAGVPRPKMIGVRFG